MIDVNNIELREEFERYFEKSQENSLVKLNCLKPVSKINIFVGANNSGKSMFIRNLSMMENFSIHPASIKIPEEEKQKLFTYIKEIIQILTHITRIDVINDQLQHPITSSMLQDFISRFPTQNITEKNKDYSSFKGFFESLRSNLEILSKTDGNYRFLNNYDTIDLTSKIPALIDFSQKGLEIVQEILRDLEGKEDKSIKCAYIPVLRGLRPFDENFTDYFKIATNRDYFKKSDLVNDATNPSIFTGLDFFDRLTKLLLGRNAERRLVEAYQKFLSEELFEGQTIELVPSPDKVVMVKIGDEADREIHLLGDGIQSAIILTFLPFVTKEPTYFFIEEPEMYLHPGLKRKILEFFNSDRCKNHKFFMTTHSNHFLDITIDVKDVSIFTFRKILEEGESKEKSAHFIVEAVDGDCSSSLELLGVRNSSVFLVNATIWVEGITDRWYLRKMLNSYMEQNQVKKLEEDVHYCFVEYGGSNITHWSFLNKEDHPIVVERLCAKALVIVDDDGGKKEDRKKELLKTLTKDNLIVLPCREIENLLPYQIVKEVVIDYETKKKNTKLQIKDFTYNDYKDEYLGKFIEEAMLENKSNKKYRDKKKSDTIANKRDFCEKALDKIEYSTLPKTTQEIIKKIHKFIVEQNS